MRSVILLFSIKPGSVSLHQSEKTTCQSWSDFSADKAICHHTEEPQPVFWSLTVTFLKLVLSAATLSLSFQKTVLRKQKHAPYWGTGGQTGCQCTLRQLCGPDSGHQRALSVLTHSVD